MENARATEELQFFNAIEAGRNDEESFYALCNYFDFLLDINLERAVEKIFKGKRNDIYLNAGDALFKIVNKGDQTPNAIWSDVISSIIGKGNRSLILFSGQGMSKSVGRTVHQLLSSKIPLDQPSFQSDKTTVCFDKNFRISIKGNEHRPFYRPLKDSEPYNIIKILVQNYKNKAEPISSGVLSKKIYGNSTKANQIASSIEWMRTNKFKTYLKNEFISNSSGYYLNDDIFDIEVI